MAQNPLSRLPLIVAIRLDNLHSDIAVRAFALNSTNKHKRILPTHKQNAMPNSMEHCKSNM